MPLELLKENKDEWRELLTQVKNSLDEAAKHVLTAAEREPIERVRFLSGQYAGIKTVYDYLRRL